MARHAPESRADAATAGNHRRRGTRELSPDALGVVIPVSFYESDGPHHYNSIAIIDAEG